MSEQSEHVRTENGNFWSDVHDAQKKKAQKPREEWQLYKVAYSQWDGSKKDGYTSRKACADECWCLFGWPVMQEPQLCHKSDKWERDHISERIVLEECPEGIKPFTLMISEGCNPEKSMKAIDPLFDGKVGTMFGFKRGVSASIYLVRFSSTDMRTVWYAMEMRRPLLPNCKTGPLVDHQLPREKAQALLDGEEMGTDWLFHSREVDWRYKCAGRPRPDRQ